MSDLVRALVWRCYDEQRFGAPLIMAIALSDEADDRGGGISESNSSLAKKTRQHERAIRRQLRAMESTSFLVCTKRSVGGVGQFSEYRIDLAVLMSDNPGAGAGLTRAQEPGLHAVNPGTEAGFLQATIEGFKELPQGTVRNARVTVDAEDLRLAEWMWQQLLRLNRDFRQPSWASWCRDIRLMRERDKRTHREVAELFQFANNDQFWQLNILSPGALRKQWERLVMQRGARGAGPVGSAPADKTCSWAKGGEKCQRDRVFTQPDGKGYCRQHHEEVEREQSRAAA